MALPEDLLAQAHHLMSVDARRPRQASLRRAISTAYYALFHLLVAAAVDRIAPANPTGLPNRIARTLVHTEMKEVCLSIANGRPSSILLQLQPAGFSLLIQSVADTFAQLQEARHRADYDLAAVYKRADTIALLQLTDDAFRDWATIRASDEATVFLSALLFAKRWTK